MRLVSGPLSLFTGKVRIALDEKGVDCTIDDVPFSRRTGYDPKPAEVLARNPKGQVPILIESDGFTLYDSTIILEYLEERFPTPPLYPADARGRGVCRQLEAAADEILFPHVWTMIRQVFYAHEARDEAAVAAAAEGFAAHLRELDATLTGRPWLCGDAFTVADVGYAMTIDFGRRLGLPIDDGLRALGAWWDRLGERPSIVRERARLDAAAARVLAAT